MPIAMAAMMPPLSCMPGWGPKIYTRTGSKNKQKNPPNFLLRSYLGYLMKLMHSDKKKKNAQNADFSNLITNKFVYYFCFCFFVTEVQCQTLYFIVSDQIKHKLSGQFLCKCSIQCILSIF